MRGQTTINRSMRSGRYAGYQRCRFRRRLVNGRKVHMSWSCLGSIRVNYLRLSLFGCRRIFRKTFSRRIQYYPRCRTYVVCLKIRPNQPLISRGKYIVKWQLMAGCFAMITMFPVLILNANGFRYNISRRLQKKWSKSE